MVCRCHERYHAFMPQLTLRIDERLAGDLKTHAAKARRSVNSWASQVLQAAVDPDLAGTDAQRTRERLARAGLLVTPPARERRRPDAKRLARARRAAGRGTSLSALVLEDRR